VVQQGGIDVVEAVKRFGDVEVLKQVSIDVAPGGIVALLGPSGCGKTTLLRSIAGLERLDAGSIAIGGVAVTAPTVHVRPEQRRIGMVFQDWALFPHLTVAQNVGYGLTREERRGDRIAESLDLVGLGGLGDRLPATLSGGQQQRVALARALAPQPTALLLDEPFSNLDTTLRVQVRGEVHRLLAELGVTTVFVTHDQEEAFVLGDRVAVMHEGRIEQLDTLRRSTPTPRTRWVARLRRRGQPDPGRGRRRSRVVGDRSAGSAIGARRPGRRPRAARTARARRPGVQRGPVERQRRGDRRSWSSTTDTITSAWSNSTTERACAAAAPALRRIAGVSASASTRRGVGAGVPARLIRNLGRHDVGGGIGNRVRERSSRRTRMPSAATTAAPVRAPERPPGRGTPRSTRSTPVSPACRTRSVRAAAWPAAPSCR
jgi:ABC-type sulfate/molybdate transport systems ATPase subunit